MESVGIPEGRLTVTDDDIIEDHTREAGMRGRTAQRALHEALHIQQ